MGDKCIPDLPESRIPLIIVYRKGEIRHQIAAWGADKDRQPEGRSLFSAFRTISDIIQSFFQNWRQFYWSQVLSISQRNSLDTADIEFRAMAMMMTVTMTMTMTMTLHQGCALPLPLQTPDTRKTSGPHRKTKTTQTQNLNLICKTQDLALIIQHKIEIILLLKLMDNTTKHQIAVDKVSGKTRDMGARIPYGWKSRSQEVPKLSPHATSIAHYAQELSKISSKGGDCVVSYYAQSMTEPKKSAMILQKSFLSYRSTPDHSHPSLTSCPTVQALQYTIPNSHLLGRSQP